MKCDWDLVKYEINLRRHGLRFELAELAFDDLHSITTEDFLDERGLSVIRPWRRTRAFSF